MNKQDMTKRACDACRRRKAKCNASLGQCANCRISGISCEYTHVLRKRGPKPRQYTNIQNSASDALATLRQTPSQLQQMMQGGAGSPHASLRPSVMQIPTSHESAVLVRSELVTALSISNPEISLEQLVDDCIAAHMHYVFPASPICSEVMLRANRHLIIEPLPATENMSPSSTSVLDGESLHMQDLRSFTLVTACCAAAILLVPAESLPCGPASARHFYRASRAMLKLYEELDLDYPESTSITIRLLQATVLHAMGKTRASYHLLNHARLLATDLYNRDPSSFCLLGSVESRLLRQNLANTLTGTRSAAILSDQPIMFDDALWKNDSDPLFVAHEQASLLDISREHSQPPFEQRLLVGVDICRRLWESAANILKYVKALEASSDVVGAEALSQRISTITDAYLDFSCILDDLPTWLQRPDVAVHGQHQVSLYQSECFWAQKTDLLMSYHSVRMIIVRNCIKQGVELALGIGTNRASHSLKKFEMSQEFVCMLESVPYLSLQANGEPCIEKVRQFGVVLLELLEKVEDESLRKHVLNCFNRLLRVLTNLNSRVSDELSRHLPEMDELQGRSQIDALTGAATDFTEMQ